ncbi:hypothetical protein RF11_01859 [Thelohanellus kitauei]|uniref:Uncharacterized protein n=1 Tax=Thelohanellus kitauei TaxID=669202 RepID=A0A0C2MFI4_THEKT|nr:hypothetical protein RF11_01859 [Thelohanellus kitauei]
MREEMVTPTIECLKKRPISFCQNPLSFDDLFDCVPESAKPLTQNQQNELMNLQEYFSDTGFSIMPSFRDKIIESIRETLNGHSASKRSLGSRLPDVLWLLEIKTSPEFSIDKYIESYCYIKPILNMGEALLNLSKDIYNDTSFLTRERMKAEIDTSNYDKVKN